jgi:hypothetical protein
MLTGWGQESHSRLFMHMQEKQRRFLDLLITPNSNQREVSHENVIKMLLSKSFHLRRGNT